MNINPQQQGLSLPFMKQKQQDGGDPSSPNRIPGLGWVPDSLRNHFIAMSGEFVGTFLFLFFAFSGTQVANAGGGSSGDSLSQKPDPAQLLYISLVFGFSLAVNAWVFFRVSGGLFNPAVTLGMCLIGAVPWLRGLFVFIAQIIGAMCAAAVVSCLFPGPMAVATSLAGGTSIAQGLFIEMFLTAELVFTIFMLAAEKHKGTFIAPVGIGLALFIAELTGVFFTGGSLNPARSFGPCVVTKSFPGYHWIYWLGPVLGALIAVGFYKFIKKLEYETANPGQDLDEKEAEVFNPDDDVTRPNVTTDPNGNLRRADTEHSKSRRNSKNSKHSGHSDPIDGNPTGGYRTGGRSRGHSNASATRGSQAAPAYNTYGEGAPRSAGGTGHFPPNTHPLTDGHGHGNDYASGYYSGPAAEDGGIASIRGIGRA
ncbi:MAG: hypothetical protein M1836_007747 [Candelina mexicana]|nr:MAG: hypothetical protein M1836_007747 [Candelina mexicana]